MRQAFLQFAVICLLGWTTTVFATSIRFQHLDRGDGLSQSYVYDVVQDATGFMWFATQDGLNRFDGYEMRTYLHEPDNQRSLPDNNIRDLLIDANGNLWVATDHGGLARYDVWSDSFVRFSEFARLSTQVRTLLQDEAGNLWIGTDGQGLFRYLSESKEFRRHTGPVGSNIWSLAQDQDGVIWAGTTTGLYSIDAASSRHYLPDDHVREIYVDSTGVLWLGTEEGLVRRAMDGSFLRYLHDSSDAESLSHDSVTALHEDSAGRFWVGTMNGLNLLKDSGGFQRITNTAGNMFSLSHNTVMSIYEDRSEVLWVGTYEGLNRWNRLTEAFELFSAAGEGKGVLSNPTVASMAADQRGNVWVGTFGGGLNRLDTTTGEIKTYHHDENVPGSLPDDRVMALAVDYKNEVWIGTRGAGLARYYEPTEKFEMFTNNPADSESISSNAITSILPLADGRMLIGTYGGGLNLFDGIAFKRYFHDPADDASISSDRIMALYQDRSGNIWVGTHDAGLNRFYPNSGVFEEIRFDPENAQSLSGDSVLNILEDGRGNLWIGTQGAGLNLWRAEDRLRDIIRFDHITESSGLASANVFSMLLDETEHLWVAGSRGLTRLNLDATQFESFDTSHGVQSMEFNHNAAVSHKGMLYFGGVNGFNRLNPDAIRISARQPETVVTKLSSVPTDQSLAMTLDSGLELYYQAPSFDVTFAALDFNAPELNRYEYRLIGLQEEWVSSGDRRYASYFNLEPGQYEFQVRSANNAGVWGEASTFPVRVHAAPWLTWWAYVVYASLALIIAAFVIDRQRRRALHADEIMAMNRQLQQEIEARKLNESALIRERNLTQTYFDLAEVVLLVMDREGIIRVVNRKACEVLGLEAHQIENHSISEFLESAGFDTMMDKIYSLRPEDSGYYLENGMVSSGGQPKQIMWRLAVLPGAGHNEHQVVASGMDVTDVRQLERVAQLREKLAAVGTMAGGVAHDFNNVLSAISGYGQLGLSEGNEAKTETYLERILEASNRAADMVSRLLLFTRNDGRDFDAFEPANPILEACALLRGSLPSGIAMHVDVPENLGVMHGDATQIHQVLMNLGTNAAKAVRNDIGELEITAQIVSIGTDSVPQGSILQPGRHLKIRVSDSGIGMEPDVIDRVFEPFYTSTGLGFGDDRGTGLGLSVVHGIVEAHMGHISVESMPGIGTTFTILLPLSEQVVRQPASGEQLAGEPMHVLLVDDEPWIVDICQQVLEMLGHSVEAFDHPVDALVAFRKDPLRFDLVVSDQNMPSINGTRFIDQLRELAPALGAILISGNLRPAQAEDIVFLNKPFVFEDLEKAILEVQRLKA